MLCGDFLRSPLSLHLCVSETRSPYISLLAIVQGMASLNPIDDDLFLENGLLSFENPNYHLDPSRLDDALNSNTEGVDGLDKSGVPLSAELYEELYQELDSVCNLTGNFTRKPSIRNRKTYASLDINSMGVDVNTGPVTNLDTPDSENNRTSEPCTGSTSMPSEVVDNAGELGNGNDTNDTMGRKNNGYLDYYMTMEGQAGHGHSQGKHKNKPDLIEHIDQSPKKYRSGSQDNLSEKPMDLNSPDSNDSHDSGIQTDNNIANPSIPHMPGQLNNDLYALPVKRRSEGSKSKSPSPTEDKPKTPSPTMQTSGEILPPGWEKHEDNDGPYYWHIKSGTIQREVPSVLGTAATGNMMKEAKKSAFKKTESTFTSSSQTAPLTVTRSNTSSALSDLDNSLKKEDVAYKRRSYPAARIEPEPQGGKPIRFAVRSLGWVEIAEEDLTPERSSKAVNKCIVDLSQGRNDLLDVVGRWGDGKDLFMDLNEGALKLIDPENLTVLNTQPIHTIRVWGVGRDNGRDFAYVARDRATRKHMCHVFRCDTPARTIANTLRDICKKIMIERSLAQNLAKPVDTGSSATGTGRTALARPTNLPTEHRRFQHRTNGQVIVTQSFPTPMEEPKKVLKAQYLGTTQVSRAAGMDTLNNAIDHLVTSVPEDQWKAVNVAVAPSVITIINPAEENKLLGECRVRYLSFLGIGQNVKHCAFIMHTAQDQFIAHVFFCEPSSGALCKTIEAACKLRYQKCLDAHPQEYSCGSSGLQTPGRRIGATLKNMIGTLTGKRNKGPES